MNLSSMSQQNASAGAILYDFLQVPGGAERVSLELARELLGDLYVGYLNHDVPTRLGYDDKFQVRSLNLNAPFLPLRTLRLMLGFSSWSAAQKYDWMIYSGNFSPLAVHNHPYSRNLLYCHSLPRFVYDLKNRYESLYPGWKRPFFEGLVRVLQPRYERAFNAMNVVIANSENVKKRIAHYLDKKAVVIHPPCLVDDKKWLGQEDYYLSLARLEPYKRVDRLIQAFLKMPDKRLIVTSGGSDRARLEALASGATNIHFTGWQNEHELKNYIGNAIATLYIPEDEDFGMSPVESMAAGKPVIGVAEGGMLETIIHGETGILISANPSIEQIIQAVYELSAKRAHEMRTVCEQRAKLFGRDIFIKKIREAIEAA
jgi:glycosyltransferase involved in cell wall biosynthesis